MKASGRKWGTLAGQSGIAGGAGTQAALSAQASLRSPRWAPDSRWQVSGQLGNGCPHFTVESRTTGDKYIRRGAKKDGDQPLAKVPSKEGANMFAGLTAQLAEKAGHKGVRRLLHEEFRPLERKAWFVLQRMNLQTYSRAP